MNWEQRKQQVFDYIKDNSGKYNGSEISHKLNIFSIKELKIENGHYIGYFTELARENKIKYDYEKEKWYILGTATTTLDDFM